MALESREPKTRLDARFEAELRRIRERNFSSIVDSTVKGVAALAAPVFDGFGKMVLALTAIGPSATLEVAGQQACARAGALCGRDLHPAGARPAETVSG